MNLTSVDYVVCSRQCSVDHINVSSGAGALCAWFACATLSVSRFSVSAELLPVPRDARV